MEDLKIKNILIAIAVVMVLFTISCSEQKAPVSPKETEGSEATENSHLKKGKPQSGGIVNVTAPEAGADIYIDGVYTGKQTPASISVSAGTHTIGVGLNTALQYLKKTVEVTGTVDVALASTDAQPAKTWKALYVGVNQATFDGCVTTYSTTELDMGYEFFQWSFKNYVEPWTYNTMNWEFYRRDISDQVVQLTTEKYVQPSDFHNYISDIYPGDYDLVVTFFRGEETGGCTIGGFIAIAWYDVTALYCDASYYTVRWHDDIEDQIAYSKANDPGVFIHEWLHTVGETFYPNRGVLMPSSRGQVVHSAEQYNYTWPWMTWYEDIIKGKVSDRDGAYGYVGIGPEAFLECSVSESALGLCP